MVGKSEGNSPFERPRGWWEDNIKMDHGEVGWGLDWFDLAQGRDMWPSVVNAVMKRGFPEHKNFSLAMKLLAFQEALCSIDLVSYCGLFIPVVLTVAIQRLYEDFLNKKLSKNLPSQPTQPTQNMFIKEQTVSNPASAIFRQN